MHDDRPDIGPTRTPLARNPEVDEWFKQKKPPLADGLNRARDIILAADRRVTETIKWGTPTFVYKGNILSFAPSKTSISLMFHRGAEIPGRHPRLEGEGKLVRTMRFKNAAEVQAGKAHIQGAVKAWCTYRDAQTQ
jgi:hypothetical protein